MNLMPIMSPHSTYQEHLDRVSRSFAYCIARLESPLREQVGLAYLICRILDTVEDAAWPSPGAQVRAFEAFEGFLLGKPDAQAVALWRAGFPGGINDGEGLLLDDAARIFSDYHALDPETRRIFEGPILSMARGMRFFADQAREGCLKLTSLVEVNQYCFFVAGVVGEVLTRLAKRLEATNSERKALVDAFHFGLFLQKVNLLKDQFGDETEGRSLVPSRDLVAASLKENAERAMAYIEWLPEKLKSYRLFCAWSLFLGLASLPVILAQSSGPLRGPNKLERKQTEMLFERIEADISDPARLRELFEKLFARAELKKYTGVFGAASEERGREIEERLRDFSRLYLGDLTADEIRSLL